MNSVQGICYDACWFQGRKASAACGAEVELQRRHLVEKIMPYDLQAKVILNNVFFEEEHTQIAYIYQVVVLRMCQAFKQSS